MCVHSFVQNLINSNLNASAVCAVIFVYHVPTDIIFASHYPSVGHIYVYDEAYDERRPHLSELSQIAFVSTAKDGKYVHTCELRPSQARTLAHNEYKVISNCVWKIEF